MIIEDIKKRAKKLRKKIILPEGDNELIKQAAKIVIEEGIADIILLSSDTSIPGVEVINPDNYYLKNDLINLLYELRKDKGISFEEAEELVKDNNYLACLMVCMGLADGVVSGISRPTKDTFKPALELIKTKNNINKASSFFLMEIKDKGVYVFSDAGLNQNPDAKDLAEIAYLSANSYELLTKEKSSVALLSHSTYGSAKGSDVDKVQESLKIAKEKYNLYNIDGELQLDAAINPSVANIKAPNSCLKGCANTLIFPNIDAGNIGYKLVNYFASAKAYGPISQGLARPINDLSRGSTVEEIVGVIAITVLQAEDDNV